MHYFAHQTTIIRTQIMGSYYFFFENFLQQNCAYKFFEFIKICIVGFMILKLHPIYIYICLRTNFVRTPLFRILSKHKQKTALDEFSKLAPNAESAVLLLLYFKIYLYIVLTLPLVQYHMRLKTVKDHQLNDSYLVIVPYKDNASFYCVLQNRHANHFSRRV